MTGIDVQRFFLFFAFSAFCSFGRDVTKIILQWGRSECMVISGDNKCRLFLEVLWTGGRRRVYLALGAVEENIF